MAARKKEPPKEEKEDWLVTYADAITLLMAFFVLLVSVSKIDMEAYDKVVSGMSEEIVKEKKVPRLQRLKIDMLDIVFAETADKVVKVSSDSNGVVLEFASGAFFRAGTADLREAAIPLLGRVAQTINSPRYSEYGVIVEGHTDNDPIQTMRYPSNWELSTGRATTVIRFFLTQEIDATRLQAKGFADTRPKFPNETPEGVAIPENKKENRRVVVRISPYIEKYKMPNIKRQSLVDMPMTGKSTEKETKK
ncbi:MAG: OmpA family protein [Alphaproteobacteria bacterium]|nr:OmpA family protein [Alphaproteobacteria bacterium]